MRMMRFIGVASRLAHPPATTVVVAPAPGREVGAVEGGEGGKEVEAAEEGGGELELAGETE